MRERGVRAEDARGGHARRSLEAHGELLEDRAAPPRAPPRPRGTEALQLVGEHVVARAQRLRRAARRRRRSAGRRRRGRPRGAASAPAGPRSARRATTRESIVGLRSSSRASSDIRIAPTRATVNSTEASVCVRPVLGAGGRAAAARGARWRGAVGLRCRCRCRLASRESRVVACRQAFYLIRLPSGSQLLAHRPQLRPQLRDLRLQPLEALVARGDSGGGGCSSIRAGALAVLDDGPGATTAGSVSAASPPSRCA